MPIRVLAVCGSSREESNLEQLVNVAAEAARQAGAEVETLRLRDLSLPVMVYGDQSQAKLESVQKVWASAKAADAFILGTPEYHGAMSGCLKNWFDFLWEELAGKVAGVVATTGGGTGDMSITSVKTSFQWCHGFVLPFHVAAREADFEDGKLSAERVVDRAQRVGTDVVRYAGVLRPAFELARSDKSPGGGFAGLH